MTEMTEMRAMELTDELRLQPVTRRIPEPKAGELLIQVSAVGVTPTEALVHHHPLHRR